jgi:glycoprotein endo-alpha-1,2-mannosidase
MVMLKFLLALLTVLALLGCSAPEQIPDARVHAFYYPWYGTPELDGEWIHWSHDQLGDVAGRITYPGGDDIGADFYPRLGPYSSNDPDILREHMAMLKRAGVGSLCASWWADGSFEDQALPALLDAAAEDGLGVSFHLEPFPGRDAVTSLKAIKSLLNRFGEHSGLYRGGDGRPLFFVYDSYLTPMEEWARLLHPDGDLTIRGSEFDATMIGLWVEADHGEELLSAGFDGTYSYFATDGFTYGSTTSHWPDMSEFCAVNQLIFVPCVGPGYADLRIRPWNTANQRDREHGDYFQRMIQAAIDIKPELIGVTSFNEWHEGTQIEPAVAKSISGFTYQDHEDEGAEGYLDQTRGMVELFNKVSPAGSANHQPE